MAHPAQTTRQDDGAGSLAAPVDARIFEGVVARVHGPGDPLRYPWGEAYRTADELVRMRDQLAGKSIKFALLHPEEHIRDGGNADLIGMVLDARIDGDLLIARVLVDADHGLEAIADGMHELSLGYFTKYTADNHQYDIVIDHLALVPRARCGAACALKVSDCGCGGDAGHRRETDPVQATGQGCGCKDLAKSPGLGHPANHMPSGNANVSASGADQKDVAMDEIQKQLDAAKARVAEVEKERDAALARADQAEKAKDASEMDARNAKKDLEVAKKDIETAQRDAAEAKAKVAAAEQVAADALAKAKEQVSKDAEDVFNARIDARLELISAAAPVIGDVKDAEGNPVYDLRKMTERDIKVAVIKTVDGDDDAAELADATKRSIDFVNGIYSGALKRFERAGSSRAAVREAVQASRDAATSTETQPTIGRAAEDIARTKRSSRYGSAWKQTPDKDQE